MRLRSGIILLAVIITIASGFSTLETHAEAGDSGQDPIELTINKSKTGYVSPEKGVRWYKVTTTKDGVLNITLSSTELKQNGMLYLYYGTDISGTTTKLSERLEYSESKKTQTVTLTSQKVIEAGDFLICFKTATDTLADKTKFTIKATLETKGYDDIEPNSAEGQEQKLPIKDIAQQAASLNMNLYSNSLGSDIVDKFKITLTSQKGIILKVKSNGTGRIKVLLKKSGENENLNAEESQQYLAPEGKAKELVISTSKAIEAGSYIVTVMLDKPGDGLMDYTISASSYTPIKSLKVSSMKVTVGNSKNISTALTVLPTSHGENFTYSSSNAKVATVSSSGLVKGIKKGTATITIKSKYTKKTAKCSVTVSVQKATKVTLSTTKKTLSKGKSFTLKATVLPQNTSNKTVTYSSSNKKVATVTSKGVVKGVGKGTATITVKTKDGSKKKATCKVTVVEKVTSIKLSTTSKKLTVGNKFTLKATVLPKTASNRSVTYTSSNTKVATVSSSGTVVAKGEGTTVITVKAKDGSGIKATCKIKVEKKEVIKQPSEEPEKPKDTEEVEEKLTLDGKNNVKIGESITIKASIKGGSWSASSSKVSISSNGSSCKVTGVSTGTVTVTYKVNGKSESITIFVKE